MAFVGVLKDSILEPTLISIFLNNLFLFVTNYCLRNYTDDNTIITMATVKCLKY